MLWIMLLIFVGLNGIMEVVFCSKIEVVYVIHERTEREKREKILPIGQESEILTTFGYQGRGQLPLDCPKKSAYKTR